ncbi:MAG: sugar ABC transporter permease [Clostridiales bacterium]|jgi:arabinogalactan oligomer/maltooligosaccharide transport system permease protein|nr:sugar ABC transporter permease [Clostridiales bacterium]
MLSAIKHGNRKVLLSMFLMGLGQLLYGQIAKGIIFLLIQAMGLWFFIGFGAKAIYGFFSLGALVADPSVGLAGDNSVVMLITGIFAFIMLGLYIACYISNVKGAYNTQLREGCGLPPARFITELKDMADGGFHKSALFLPVIGVCVFNILPIVYMILIAFTDYGGDIVPPALVSWTGLSSFARIISLGQFAPTFSKILQWNALWAIMSTAINYMCGLGLALLLNKPCVKGKTFWRAFPVLAYAVPGFITLIGFKFMFSYGGPINQMITEAGGRAVGFLDLDAKWTARLIGLLVNAWIAIPSSMLLATGILSNMDNSLYESATIDGAGAWKRFKSITLPFVLFATMPVLITQFIGNFNNFGIFYFLRGGLYIDGYFLASDTDLLINWLYNLSIDNNYYSIGAAISLIIFAITSAVALAVYMLSPSYRQEEMFK